MRRRRILFLSQRVPFPPDKGDKIRSFHQVEYLAARHDVHAAFFVDGERDGPHVAALEKLCREVIAIPWRGRAAKGRALAALVLGRSLTCATYEDAAMREALKSTTERHSFDVMSAYSSSMAPYAMQVPAGRRVLDLCDADSQKWLDYAERLGPLTGWTYRREGGRLRAHELRCIEQFDATIVITPRERAILDPMGIDERLHVIPNGAPAAPAEPRDASLSGPIVAFCGSMDYRPNIDAVEWFSREVWPVVRRHQPVAQFLIIGRAPTARVRRLARIGGVEVVGEVAEVGSLLKLARVVVAPLRIARGLPNKVLEAMAFGRPVVATSTAANCLSAVPGREIVVADGAEDFAGKVVQLLDDDASCDRIAKAARARVEADYGWSRNLQRYEQVLLGEAPSELNLPEPVVRRAARRRRNDAPLVSGSLGSYRARRVC